MFRSGLAATLVLASMAWVPTAAAQGLGPTLSYEQPLTPQGIRMVQQRLRELGVYAGDADGVWGANSQAALQRFQQNRGLQVTGQLNQATVATLGLDPTMLVAADQAPAQGYGATQPPAAGQSAYAEPLSRDVVQTIQGRLRQLGFYNGAADGIWGPNTARAVERFQQSRSLQPTGQLNPATVTAMGLDPNNLAAQSRGAVPREGYGSSSPRLR